MVADDPDRKIPQKFFHTSILNDYSQIAAKEAGFVPIPKKRDITPAMVHEKYLSIKDDIEQLVAVQMQKMLDSYELSRLIVQKKGYQQK